MIGFFAKNPVFFGIWGGPEKIRGGSGFSGGGPEKIPGDGFFWGGSGKNPGGSDFFRGGSKKIWRPNYFCVGDKIISGKN